MAIDEGTVRERAQALCDALMAGDVEKATEDVSDELRRNLGEVVALLPLPANEAVIDSVERGASAFVVVLRVAGETDETMIQTRWKDRDGKPTIVEVSHLSQTALAAPAGTEEATDDAAAPG